MRRWLRASRNFARYGLALSDRLRRYDHGGTPVIHSRKLLAVLFGFGSHLNLRAHGRNAPLSRGRHFHGQRTPGDAMRPCETCAAGGVSDGHIVDHCVGDGAVVDVNVGDGDVVHAAVVVEPVVAPVATLIAHTGIAVSVVDSAVIADVRAPIAVVISVASANPTPIAGRPQEAGLRRTRPCARHPVVALRRVCPVARRP